MGKAFATKNISRYAHVCLREKCATQSKSVLLTCYHHHWQEYRTTLRPLLAGCEAETGDRKKDEGQPSSKRPTPTHDPPDWAGSIPSYLQSFTESEFCDDWTDAINEAEAVAAARKKAIDQGLDPEAAADQSRADVRLSRSVTTWNRIRQEATRDIEGEPMLSSFLFTSILSHESFGEALAFVLSNRIADETLLPTQLFSLFMTLERQHPEVLKGALADLQAVFDRVSLLSSSKATTCTCCCMVHRVQQQLDGVRTPLHAAKSGDTRTYDICCTTCCDTGGSMLADASL